MSPSETRGDKRPRGPLTVRQTQHWTSVALGMLLGITLAVGVTTTDFAVGFGYGLVWVAGMLFALWLTPA